MLWLFLALITALSVAVRDVSIKAMFEDMEPFQIAGLELFWSMPILGLLLLTVPVPELDTTFWGIFIISLPLNWLAYILYLRAIKASPVSLSVPLLAFTPVFMILTGLLVLGETINQWGGLGICLIVFGSYILNLEKKKKGILEPILAVFRERGSLLMLIVAILFSFAAVLGKKAILHSSALFFSFFFFLVFDAILLAGLLVTGKTSLSHITKNSRKGMWLGGLLVIHVGCHGMAIAVATAVYMIAVKRSSILFTVLLGWLILKEGRIKTRATGALLMFLGVVLITVLG
ncbi:MAG: EamA family transporter [Desulfobulbaceae bacterium]|nr:EamA family transporter [Desulfobulbaceae bacterium]MCK5544486.1 EamA family transporter [Desulfobulbaceae bacterium]